VKNTTFWTAGPSAPSLTGSSGSAACARGPTGCGSRGPTTTGKSRARGRSAGPGSPAHPSASFESCICRTFVDEVVSFALRADARS
jgi:hypothetical protein